MPRSAPGSAAPPSPRRPPPPRRGAPAPRPGGRLGLARRGGVEAAGPLLARTREEDADGKRHDELLRLERREFPARPRARLHFDVALAPADLGHHRAEPQRGILAQRIREWAQRPIVAAQDTAVAQPLLVGDVRDGNECRRGREEAFDVVACELATARRQLRSGEPALRGARSGCLGELTEDAEDLLRHVPEASVEVGEVAAIHFLQAEAASFELAHFTVDELGAELDGGAGLPILDGGDAPAD